VIVYTRRGNIAVLAIDNPPVNALGAAVRTALADRLQECLSTPGLTGIVLTGRGAHFSAGADIKEFDSPVAPDAPTLPQIIDRIERARVPIVAAMHGTVAGGALELALACHYRVAAQAAVLALPEVTLGFIPGAGGTQRLPRLVGLDTALDLILSGRRTNAAEAHRIGLVDVLVNGDLVDAVVEFASLLGGRAPRRTCDIDPPAEDPEVVARHEARIAKIGARAPRAAIASLRAGLSLPFAEGIKREREIFLDLVRGPEARALRYVFFAERAARDIAGIDNSTATLPIRSAGVVGCGTMGAGIAMVFAAAGIPVRVLESDPDALSRGLTSIRQAYAKSQASGRCTTEQATQALAHIEGVIHADALADADIIVEAVFEEMDVKQAVFRILDTVCRPDAILATNTSSLDVDMIAGATSHPDRVIGLHFFSPAHIMRLIEIVRPAAASATTLATVAALAKQLGKIGVVVGVCDGFVGNRMLFAYRRQADFLLEEGALPEQVDGALRRFGLPMGPYQMTDLAGLDISWRIRKRQAATRPPHLRYSTLADRLCEQGRFGQKTGAGWYRYAPGSRTPEPDPEVEALIRSVSQELGLARRNFTDDEIVERCLFPLVNEGARILEEGKASRASDVDVIWIHGYGFPRYRGGPMFWADTVGLAHIAQHIERLHREQGELVRPSTLLAELARSGRTFHTGA
jgi:3-hydroxyacyl-CoA dehydrogenase